MRRSPCEPPELRHEPRPRGGGAQGARAPGAERRLGRACALLGAAVLGFLAWRGGWYGLLPPALRASYPRHAPFGSAGDWGWSVGFASTVFMLCNLVYALRKRLAWLSGMGDLRTWRVLHAFAGLMSSLLVALHVGCPARRPLAAAMSLTLALVALTGVAGRRLLGLAPAAAGLELEELQRRFVDGRTRLELLLARLGDPAPLKALHDAAVTPMGTTSLTLVLARWPLRALGRRWALRRAAALLPDAVARTAFREDLRRCETLRLQIGCYRTLGRATRRWRVLHASLAALLVLATTAHVGLGVIQGRWAR